MPTAATPGTLPQRLTKPNQPTARSERTVSESLATVAVTVPTRATIAVQLNLAKGSHIARNCSKLPEMTRHLLIALQPRRALGHPTYSRDWVEPSRLRLDSTISPRHRRRYPLSTVRSMQSLASPHYPPTIQIKKKRTKRSLLLNIDTHLTGDCGLSRKMIHFRQPLVFWQPLSCFFGNLWVVYPEAEGPTSKQETH